MPSDKPKVKKLKTGVISRGMGLAGLAVGAGRRVASHRMKGWLGVSQDKLQAQLATVLKDQATALANQLGQLKGSVMKVGQMLSMYGEHFLPSEVNSVLKTLQFQSPALEWNEIQKILEAELSREKLDKLEIVKAPLASASIGQVHRAKEKHSGRELILKVQYPGVDKAIESDLKVLGNLISLVELMPKVPHMDMLLAEVSSLLRQEVDYENERHYIDLFGSLLAGDSRFVVPKSVPELSTKKVLALTFEPGLQLDSPEVQQLSQLRRDKLGAAALDLYFQELFVWGRVQTDPHLGNYRVRLGSDEETDRLVLYDFGAVREFTSGFVANYRSLVIHSIGKDRQGLLQAASKLGFVRDEDPEPLKNLFEGFCYLMVEPFSLPNPGSAQFFDDQGCYDWNKSDLPHRLTSVVGKVISSYHFRMPPQEVVFLDRKTSGMFTMLSVLGSKLSSKEILEPYIKLNGLG